MKPTAPRAHPKFPQTAKILRALENRLTDYGSDATEEKLRLLDLLADADLPGPKEILRLHEALCFLRAYPDSPEVLTQVERMLRVFANRNDLKRHRDTLADTGIAGTDIRYVFFWPTARWLARRWPSSISIDWPELDNESMVEERLHLLALYTETPGLDEFAYPLREWIDRMKGPNETDARFLIRRWEALRMTDAAREHFYQEQYIPLRLAPGRTTPSRTHAKAGSEAHLRVATARGASSRGAPIAYQMTPLNRSRPDLRKAVEQAPVEVRSIPPADGRKLIDLARASMATRSRDLDAFAYGDPADVRLVDFGDGLQFAAIGQIPERRLLLESVYGFLTLKNSIPIGYVLSSALYRSCEVAYNVFETYRGAEAAQVYGHVLAMLRHLFNPDTFTIYPYQLGHDNEEGLQSGAWWFYQKLGFRPKEPRVVRLMNEELRLMRRDPKHRSSIAVLKELAVENTYLHLGLEREDVIGILPLANIGLQVTRYLAERFGSEREKGQRVCSKEAASILGLTSLRGFSRGERLAWDRWSPLVRILPGIEKWSAVDRRALVDVVRAKGGQRESDFVRAFDEHRALREALRELALRGE